jgi:hypothetical protein
MSVTLPARPLPLAFGLLDSSTPLFRSLATRGYLCLGFTWGSFAVTASEDYLQVLTGRGRRILYASGGTSTVACDGGCAGRFDLRAERFDTN